MVQRKVPSKLGIQADDVKSEKRLGNPSGPSSPRHQDSKNRGPELKKKMKKSRSIKRSDFESLRSSPTFRREVPQPGKPPPPLGVPPAAAAATPHKQSPIKGSDASPNYMKSTTSFDARKERPPASSRATSQTSVDSKSPKKISNNSKFRSGSSGHKPAKTLTRTSSLKLVRTLTKSPSFKPARASAKKCSEIVLCEDLNAQRATCSSTMKDSKFPIYLALTPGSTESEGTSVTKVCPYTYCSLNGHHHTPLPPLKCFLSARRRTLKTQKSIKLGCLSPRRAKPSVAGMKEVSGEMTLDMDEKPAIQEEELNSSAINPLIQEDHMDFFIEIYIKDMEDAAETTSEGKENGGNYNEAAAATAELDGGQVVEGFSGEGPCSVIDFEGNLDEINEVISTTKTEIAEEFFSEELQDVDAAEEVYSPSSTQEEETPECLINQSYVEVEGSASTELDKTDSEASDMEWDEGQYSALSLDNEVVGNPAQSNDGYDFGSGSSFGDDDPSFHNEPIFKSDDIVGSNFDEIPADEGLELEEFFEEDGESSGAGCSDGSSDPEDSYQNLGSYESLLVFNDQQNIDQDLQPGDDETECTSNIKDEASIDHKDIVSPEDKEATGAFLGNQGCDSCQNFPETHQDWSSSDNYAEVYQSHTVCEGVLVGSLLLETKNSETNQSQEQELPTAAAGDGMEEKEQEDAAKSLIRIPTFDLLQGLYEADQDTTHEDNNEVQIGATAGDGESYQASAGECLTAATQLHSSDKQSPSNEVVEDQNHSEKDCQEAQSFKTPDSMGSEDHQTYSGLNKVSAAENSNEHVDEMEVEHSTMSDTEESFPSARTATSTKAKIAFFRRGSHSTEELPKAPNNLRITRSNRPVEELKEPREFNPREPNYLPIKPDPEAEKVDLRHQMMDEKKNAEEWMLDYALRQAVTKLAPAKKRKVAVLVEAFEKVMPIPKYESHLKHTPAAFAHARPIQACS